MYQAFSLPLSTLIVVLGNFRLYDLDRDGYISREEMIAVVESVYKMVVCINEIAMLHITLVYLCVCVCGLQGQMVEFDEMNTPQEKVKNIFDTMDQVCDGKLSFYRDVAA